ncbi:TetR-like C-terminal domain-containing protein [Nonomuraea dietziae]|uniref:TetR-like C-terminal domain-containing protein n=1 Tax=Nonomuraea dietziae TaxID=65515 RepID=UPI001FE95669
MRDTLLPHWYESQRAARHAPSAPVRVSASCATRSFRTGTSLSELRDTLLPPGQATAFETIVARAVERGELPDVPRASRVVNLPLDLLRHDMFMMMRPASRGSLVEIVDEVWLPLLGVPGAPSASSAPAPPA